jgi:hypothetical protein
MIRAPGEHRVGNPARSTRYAARRPKDGVRGRLQIVYGLLTSKDGISIAIEVFQGNTGDPATVAAQVTKVKDRFGIGEDHVRYARNQDSIAAEAKLDGIYVPLPSRPPASASSPPLPRSSGRPSICSASATASGVA